MGGSYSCKCDKEYTVDHAAVCILEQTSPKYSKRKSKEMFENYKIDSGEKIKLIKDVKCNLVCTPAKCSTFSKKQIKDKNKSELLKVPLEIINELNQEEMMSPTIVKNKPNQFDFEENPIFKIKIFNAEIENSNSEKNLINLQESKSLLENNNFNNIPIQRLSKKGSTYHNKNNSIETWRNLSIGMIVPLKKLNSQIDNEILLQGELFKYIIDENNHKPTTNYSLKFFAINKSDFTYYKSKESFLSLHNPLAKLSFFQIKKVDRLSFRSKEYTLNKNYHHFIIELINENDGNYFLENLEGISNIHKDSSKSNQVSNILSQFNILTESNDKSLCLPILLNDLNSKKGICDVKFKKANKISLIKSDSKDKNISILEAQPKTINSLLNFGMNFNIDKTKNKFYIFACKDVEIINKIVYLLNYLIEKGMN